MVKHTQTIRRQQRYWYRDSLFAFPLITLYKNYEIEEMKDVDIVEKN